ncbi:MAG: GTPase HflX [Azospirillaceae bacterium]
MTIHMEQPRDGDVTRAIVIHPVLHDAAPRGRSPEACLDEAVGLAHAIRLDVVLSRLVRVAKAQPATLIGGGAIEELAEAARDGAADIVVVDAALTPVQQRNLETRLDRKVIDRTGLILEIFGERARTREGVLQVDLAHLTYQRSRLVRSWTHLERQRGGAGFLGGPGERQIEIDRRLIDEKITRLKKDLEQVRRTRGLHRGARERVPYPVVALVGYTNAGKSTLFNRLTESQVVAKDLLFATLDPTMRQLDLGDGLKVILSDTVGFISDLPTQLVAAFRATLEEVDAADLILHVRDIAHEDTAAQRTDVAAVLGEMGIDVNTDERILEVLNKVDLLADDDPRRHEAGREGAFAISALTGEGVKALLEEIHRRLSRLRETVEVSVDITDGSTIAWLHERGQVIERNDDGDHAHMRVALAPADVARLERRLDRTVAPVAAPHPTS